MTANYLIGQLLFLKVLGICFFGAFWSLWRQVLPLYGKRGICPIAEQVEGLSGMSLGQYLRFSPTLFHFSSSDRMLVGATVIGMVASILVVIGIAPTLSLFFCWILYLSFVVVGETFLSYQWDILLLEVGCAAIGYSLLQPAPVAMQLVIWVILFRLMFSSGMVKLASGCPCWRGGSAMSLHYETQPLPNRIGWFFHQQPKWMAHFSTYAVLGLELMVPFMLWFPQPIATYAAGMIAGLMVLIILTGSYAFFNLLTIALCLTFVADYLWASIFDIPVTATSTVNPFVLLGVNLFAFWLLALNCRQILRLFRVRTGLEQLPPKKDYWMICNGYGLFAHMTTKRDELVIEGSDDGENWLPYRLPYQPQLLNSPPRQAAPHQPRLDWQMWFASLGSIHNNGWLQRLLRRILEGNVEVLQLFEEVPFSSRAPRMLRVVRYPYHFTSWSERRETGNWWKREEASLYVGPLERW